MLRDNALADATAIPSIIYGTAWKEEHTASLTELALRSGFRGIDTANQRRHYLEEGVGDALKAAYREGIVTRKELFLQTKFTRRHGQDHRLPYDPEASLSIQVSQSLTSSLEHLGTDHVDSYVLHGPSSRYEWTQSDQEVWQAMAREQEAGRARLLGVSNISLRQLRELVDASSQVPRFVQNRCFAKLGWDREIRHFCRERNLIYQGFSLLTANPEIVRHPFIIKLSEHSHATPAEVIFSFAHSIGILPLTGTSNPEHMKQDLGSLSLELSEESIFEIERLSAE